jgi:CRP-like cAMP-binding protein
MHSQANAAALASLHALTPHLEAPEFAGLSGWSIFRGIGPAALEALVAQMNLVELKAGDVLFREGEASDCVYFILSGELLVERVDPCGVELVASIGEQACVGELGVLDGSARSATVIARSRSRLLSLSKADFAAGVESGDVAMLRLSHGIACFVASRLRWTTRRLIDMLSLVEEMTGEGLAD